MVNKTVYEAKWRYKKQIEWEPKVKVEERFKQKQQTKLDLFLFHLSQIIVYNQQEQHLRVDNKFKKLKD